MLAPIFGQPARRRPNVLLIVAGVWRAQAVPWAGDADADVETPNLRKLSRQGVAFSRAYSCCPRARALPCLLRGVFPHTPLGMDATIEALLAESPSLRPLLRNAGYRVAAFKARQADEIVSFVHASGGETADQPFFAEWIFENLGGGGLIERRPAATLHVRENVPAYAEAAARTDLRTFYARAAACDRDIGEVLEALGEPGDARYENTIVVFTSLHGEQFGSHGELGDDVAYEESVRIPLLIRYPRVLPRAGASDMLVSQVDVAPTLLTWCGVPVPETVQGRDLAGLLARTGTVADLIPNAIYAEGRLGQPDEWRMLVAGYDKLVSDTQGNATQLFNLADDPYEMANLARAPGSLLKRDELLAQQRAWMKRLEDGVDPSGLLKKR